MPLGTVEIVLLAANAIGSIFGAISQPKPRKTVEEKQYDKMVHFYKKVGQREDFYRKMAVAFGATPRQAASKINGSVSKMIARDGLYKPPMDDMDNESVAKTPMEKPVSETPDMKTKPMTNPKEVPEYTEITPGLKKDEDEEES